MKTVNNEFQKNIYKLKIIPRSANSHSNNDGFQSDLSLYFCTIYVSKQRSSFSLFWVSTF